LADWTLDEARAYLPRLRRLVEIIRRAALTSARARSNGHGAGPGEPETGAKEPGRTHSVSATAAVGPDDAAGPAEALAEIEQHGIVLRDLERGLVDFPSRHPNGRQVLLCWQMDEPELAWWHLPEDGFAGRRPLPLPPEL
jgi:hypothetical protein